MIVAKNGYVVVYTKKGEVSLHDSLGQCIFKAKQENMTKEKALEIIYEFSRKGIIALC